MAAIPPAPVQKKSGLGCLGCGCLILALLALLFLGLVAGIIYWGYAETIAITSSTPATVPSFDGGDDAYESAKQKMADFDHDLNNQQAATVHLTADEINTLISRNPLLTEKKIHLFVSFNNDQARMQISVPTSFLTSDLVKDRYLNGDVSFGLNFQPNNKTLNFDLKNFQIGNETLPKNSLPTLQSELNPAFNGVLQKDPKCKLLLDHAKSIEIKDGEVVIETE